MLVEFSRCGDRSALCYWRVMLLFYLWTIKGHACGRLHGEGGELSLSVSLSRQGRERERGAESESSPPSPGTLPHACSLMVHKENKCISLLQYRLLLSLHDTITNVIRITRFIIWVSSSMKSPPSIQLRPDFEIKFNKSSLFMLNEALYFKNNHSFFNFRFEKNKEELLKDHLHGQCLRHCCWKMHQ